MENDQVNYIYIEIVVNWMNTIQGGRHLMNKSCYTSKGW